MAKSKAAQELGRKGGRAKAASRTPEERSEEARRLNQARWAEWNAMTEEEREAARTLKPPKKPRKTAKK